MIAKIIFTKPSVKIPINNQCKMNSYIHRCLGKDNNFHDSFSEYSVSSLQGGKYKDGYLEFKEEPYINIASNDMEFISYIIECMQNSDVEVFDMKCARVDITDFPAQKYFDKIMTISPILLKHKGKKITFKDDGWLDILTEKCIAKLKHHNINDDTFELEIYKPENMKKKIIYVGDVFNPASMAYFIVRGKKETRETLYNLGLGCSCGSGFGAIKILS